MLQPIEKMWSKYGVDHPRSKKCRNIWQGHYKMRGVISARFKNTLLFMVEQNYSTASSSRRKPTHRHTRLRVYGGGGVGRRTTPDIPVQACDSNYITLKHIQIIDTLVAKFRKAPNATPQHGTFKTPGQASPNPATLETLGSTSAVPLHSLEAWKAACVNSWIHRHGAACGKGFVSELSCRNHACRTTAEQRQLTLLASCRFQHKPSGNYLPQTPKKAGFGSKLEAKV